jgi:Uma2 family endonuclease
MSAAISNLAQPPAPTPEPVFRLSVAQYHAMIRGGVLTDDDPVELLEGILVVKMPKNPPHETAVGKCQDELPKLLPPGWIVRLQAPVTLMDGEPEPDVAIVRGSRPDYATRHPGPADIGAIIELADTTLERDRGIKLRGYARAGIQTYCVVNLADRIAELYLRPQTKGEAAIYDPPMRLKQSDLLSLHLDDAIVQVPVQILLP